jgi:hypothetical protein
MTGRVPVITWAVDGSYQVATMPRGEVLEVITAEEMLRMDSAQWQAALDSGEQMASPDWRTNHRKLPEHGHAYYLLGPSHCSACWGRGDHRRDRQGVVMSVNTCSWRLDLVGHWHAVWSCTDEINHWSGSAMRTRLLETGSVTP